MIGAGRQSRREILDEWKTMEREWEAQKAFMERERKARPELAELMAPNEERAWVNYAAATKKYLGLAEEADAYMVQSKFAQAFREHEALKAAMEGRAAKQFTGPFSGALNAAADESPPTRKEGAKK
jgi:nicotinamide mononucleotide adenylyltransferase